MDNKEQKLSLKREVGLAGAVSLIGGTMIGSGIFMSPQTVLYTIGSPGASLVVWACCGLLVILASFCYAELGTVIKESGGEYIYILRTSGPVVAFLLIFSSVLFVRPAGVVGISLSFAQYVVAPFYPDCTPPVILVKCVAATAILTLATVNCLNVRFSMSVQVFFMVAKVFALVVIIIGGMVMLVRGHDENFEDSFANTNVGINSIGIAFYQGLWSYDGWNNLNYVTEELKRPEVNLPRAVVIAISLVTGLYLLVNVSYLTVMTPKELMSSNAVAVTWGNKVLGSWGWIMSVAAALSAFGSLNGTFFSGGRVCFVAAREGHMPDILSMAHVRRLTPSPALIFTTIISLVVLIPGDFQSIVNYFSFTAWFFYAITMCGLLYLKIKKPELPRPYKVPIILPILVLVAAVFLVLAPIIDNPQIEYLYVSLFIFSGILVYIPFIHYKLCPGLLTKLTLFLQLFLEVAPADKNL
ncbi:b(0,+)-type amino acid transporter 1-like [Solea senegalensis]|uniref:b(0,+)-type amino acid transporter 1 n=1 Tax=Solea senegalensis TaxID=28829 RepID=A0AAV6RYG5_SOLSE|nr:b(0,+)-type amino acid transporter 1 isoform X3 [Solea senegalensis]KAG7509675.1 b(0,+)-type amino acid transporter 1-like [Solea senegalensis]